MNNLMETLCNSLEDELERQETILRVCRDQQQALLGHDLEFLAARTAALEALARDAAQGEKQRRSLLDRLATDLGLSRKSLTLSEIIESSAEPWQSRLCHAQVRLQETALTARQTVRSNARVLRRSLRTVQDCLDTFTGTQKLAGPAYDAQGGGEAPPQNPALVLDHRG
ncbi:MAG: flagellar export chaperone FlgN [Candidatus Hydrogenedentes bacterium]|nr:flagellar export chaperone FlgN [Candidatus Hydrogenedentota bacterium]